MNCSTPGLPVHHQLPEFTQTHVHLVSDAIQPSHPLLSPLLLPPTPPSIRVFSDESTLRMRWSKYWSFSFSIIPSKDHPCWSPSEWTGWISLQSKGLSRVFSNTTVQKHQFFGAQPGGLQSMGLLRVGHDWATSLSPFTFMHWRRKWQPTLVFSPGESHGQRSLAGYSPWGHKESDITERLHFHFLSHTHTWLLEKPQLWLDGPLPAKKYLCFLTCCLGWS